MIICALLRRIAAVDLLSSPIRKSPGAPARLFERLRLRWLCLLFISLACVMWMAASDISRRNGLDKGVTASPPFLFKSRLGARWSGWRPGIRCPEARRTVSASRIYTAPHNGRKYMASVLNMANEADVYGPTAEPRLPPFLAAWADAWPGLHMQHQFSFANHPELRGYGCLAGHYLAIADSLRYLEAHNETCDFHLVFEDDAMPFKESTWPALSKVNHLDARLDDLVAAGGIILILGGNFFNYNIDDAAAAAGQPQGGILHAGHGDGSYGYVYECSAMAPATRFLHRYLHQMKTNAHVEKVLWDAFRSGSRKDNKSTGVYMSAPLMVDHRPGISMTWNRLEAYPFEGDPNFWANEKVRGLATRKDYP